MAVVQNLYQIFKIPASVLVANNCIMNDYSISRGLKEGNIVSIGDNLVFQQIRYHYGDYTSHEEVFEQIQRLRHRMHEYKREGDYKKANILNQLIIKKLFVKDIVNVYVDKAKSDFHKFRTKGFTFNGVHYTYLCSGSGQIRRNTATFINSSLHAEITKNLECGFREKTSQFSLAKFSAYFALSFSSILWVRTPRVCVVKDFYHTLKNQPVDFIVRDPNKTAKDEAKLEERIMDIELNCADGQGLIDPGFAELWGKDMHLDYTPCSFVARSCFIKGNLVPFDFKEYAEINGITKIRDKWGVEYDIKDIDVILSESQFKVHKYYNSWQEYQRYAQAANIHWGVARYNKKRDDEYVLANYQYIQALTLSKDDISELIKPTVNWINQICSGEPLPALLYMFGGKSDNAQFQTLYSAAQTNATKAVVKNIDFLQDSYVQHKIYKNITESINRAMLGKIWIKGNYQFCIADPLAQCQAALGLDPVGIIGADEVYSKWWNDRGATGVIDVCRSPMIDLHEHNPSKLHSSSTADYWFRYIYSGIIFSTYDTATARMEDSDFDGDIVLTTDNPYFIKGSNKDHNIITYEKGAAGPGKLTLSNITKSVYVGFGTGVGGFSNTATCLYALAGVFKDKPEHKEQYEEILYRIKLLREIVGQEIDRIKGAAKPYVPTVWKKFETIDPEDDDATKAAKFRHNSLVVSKKPYFFRYLYPSLNEKFKQFEASYNQVSRDMFGIKFKKLLKKENKTEDELNLVRKYQKYSPLITSNCTMNILCREIESTNFDIKFEKTNSGQKKKATSMLPTYEGYFADKFDQEKYNFVKRLYQKYTTRKQVKHISSLRDNLPIDAILEDYTELKAEILKAVMSSLQNELIQSGIAPEEFLFYCNRISSSYSNFNWGFAWDILEDNIIQHIPYGKSYCPIHDENGTEYLGEKFTKRYY